MFPMQIGSIFIHANYLGLNPYYKKNSYICLFIHILNTPWKKKCIIFFAVSNILWNFGKLVWDNLIAHIKVEEMRGAICRMWLLLDMLGVCYKYTSYKSYTIREVYHGFSLTNDAIQDST